MTSPLPDNAREPAARSASTDRRKIARKWAYQVSLTTYMPRPQAEIECELLDLTNRVFDAMTSEPLPTDRVAAAGARLVELQCVGSTSLRCSVEVLAGALLSDPQLSRLDRIFDRVARLLGAFASGYTNAIRSATLQQQDNLHRALLEAMWLSQRQLALSEARLGAVLAGSTTGIAITDLDGKFVRANAAFCRILGRSAGRSAQPTLFELVRRRGGPDLGRPYRQLRAGTVDRLTLRLDLSRDNGETVGVALSASMLRDSDDQPSDFVTIMVDETAPAGSMDAARGR